ncbi:alpha/beta hydrolase [Flavobacterium sp. MAH-1]|uniref:Alpha/beta hydrolase n=1 Tax=Flavobacterium agri TaxID=2743471 RepID=A0A7Y9C645_9FLAO|nr:alpha/beta hydrolase [Flavobacterium agri]NUY81065.1 alpha/beta hydrolase [Flavobacterium agri]NYA71089.1 alpha/beta hydrolase [Flavobacterium agri]
MRKLRIFLYVIVGLLTLHVSVLTVLYFFQEKLIFHAPERLAADYKFDYTSSFEEINIATSGNVSLNGLLFHAQKPAKGLVFYLHGNGGSLEGWGYMSEVYTKLGYDLFILDYRSYGKSGGDITSMDEFLEDVRTAYKYMAKRYPEDEITVVGFSIGTGPAAWLASEEHPKNLILQAPYYDLASVAIKRFPMVPMFLLRYNFTTSDYLKNVKCPIYMFHGTADKVVVYENSVKIKAENPKVKFYSIKNLGHIRFNDDLEYQSRLAEILN